jgi:hypothetical protein
VKRKLLGKHRRFSLRVSTEEKEECTSFGNGSRDSGNPQDGGLVRELTALLPRALADWFFIYDDKIQIFGTGVMTGMQATVQLCPFI